MSTQGELLSHQIHVWAADLNTCEPQALALEKTLSPDELQRASSFHFERDRRHYIATRGILRSLLAQYLKTPVDQIRFRYSSRGRPELANHVSELDFNVAHSGSMALYGFSRGRRIGIDLEWIRQDLAFEPIVERYFSSREVAAIKELPAEERRRAFFICWTRKEAYVKARGDGLAFALDQFDVSVASESPVLLDVRGEPGAPAIWDLKNVDPAPGYVGTVAAEGRGWQLLSGKWS